MKEADACQENRNRIFKYVSMKGAKATLLNKSIQFSYPKDLNDPFDCLPGRPVVEDAKQELERMKEIIAQREIVDRCLDERAPKHYLRIREQYQIAVSCFSSVEGNYLMWSHYAEGFKGCCLAFDSEKLLFSLGLKEFHTVEYDRTRLPMPVGTDQEEHINVLRRKSCSWEYEQEKRLLLSAKADDRTYSVDGKWYRSFSPDALVSVTVGMMASQSDLKDIGNLCKRCFPRTIVYKTSPDDTTYSYKEERFLAQDASHCNSDEYPSSKHPILN